MKLRKLMFGALACLAFAACSDDNDAVNGVNPEGKNPDQMVKINIVTPAGTRAPGFQAGSDAENKVTNAVFVFYHDNTFVQASHATDIDFTFDKVDDNNSSIEKISQAVVILNKPEMLPNKVVAILNSPASLTKEILNNKKPSMETLKGLISDCKKAKEGEFVMSNSVWAEDFAAPITDKNLVKKNPNPLSGEEENDEDDVFPLTEAEEKALDEAEIVDIYVERVLAKVNVKIAATQDKIKIEANSNEIIMTGMTQKADGNYTTDAGTVTKIVPVVRGLHLSYCSPASYLVKKYNGEGWKGGESFPWVDANNFRSYWGKSIPTEAWKEGFAETTTNFAWGHKQYSNVTLVNTTNEYTFYTQENTSSPDPEAEGATLTSTKLVITAQLMKVDTNGAPSEESIGDLVKYKGLYFTEADFLQFAAQKLVDAGYKFKEKAEATDWSSDWAKWLKSTRKKDGDDKDKAWEIRVVTKNAVEDYTLMKDGQTDAPTVDDINKFLYDEIGNAWEWQDGRCYYYVDIEHHNQETAVIRNHVYQLTINSITGMGTPVYDPDNGEDENGNPDEDGKPDEDTDKDDDPNDPNDPDDDPDDDEDPEGGDEDPDGEPDDNDDEDPIIPEKPTEDAFYVSAKLNILKWAIVPEQKEDITW